MRNRKKIFSLVLSLLLLLSCFAVTVSAEETACEHSFTDTVVSAGCVSQGYTLHTCSKCGYYTKTDLTPALGHTYGSTPVVNTPATCYAEGLLEWECTRCHAHKTQTLSVLEHIDNDKNGVCDNCGYEMGRETVFSPYDWLKAFFEAMIKWFREIFA